MFSARSCLLQMEKALQRHVIGQSEAVKAVSRACVIHRAGLGLRDNDGPIGSFLFASAGQTGVGRTLLAKSLAIEYFGDKDAMISLNMNDYKYGESVSELIKAIRCCRPHSILLLSEIQEAHYTVPFLIHEALRDGKITDVYNGWTVDLKNTIIIITSSRGNIHNNWDVKNVDTSLFEDLPSVLMGWIDEVVMFKKLGTPELRGIMELMVKEFSETLQAQKNVKIAITERLKKKLVEESLDESKHYGAKSLKRTFNNVLVYNVAEGIENGRVKDGVVTVDIDPNGNVVFCY